MRTLTISLLSTCALGAFALAGAALADDATSSTSASAPSFGFNPNSPYQLQLLYTGEEWDNAQGGLKTGSLYMQNADVKLSVDTDKAFGWTGGQFVVEGWWESDVSLGNRLVGALDQQSPIDTAWNKDIYRLYQAYYDQNFASTGTDVRFGIYDLESEFGNTKPMSLFLNKNLTWNTALDQSGTMPQNGNIGPGNYPYTPLAFRVRQQFDHDWSAQVVVADGIADSPYNQASNDVYFNHRDGAMIIGEVDYTPTKYTKVMAGTWYLSSDLPTNNETFANGNPRSTFGQEGAYIGGATRLYTQQGRRGLDGFLNLGWSNPTCTNVYESVNGGFVYTGLLDMRPDDKAGISVNVNAAPGSYITENSLPHDYETSYEATYRAKINDWLTVQPDAEYIVDPNYALKNDFVFGVHFEIGHVFGL